MSSTSDLDGRPDPGGAGSGPDATAVLVALWRAMHLSLDDAPHVLVDDVGLLLAGEPDALATLALPAEGWRDDPRVSGPLSAMWRPQMVVRARFTEDLVEGLVAGGEAEQYVILGAGLDTFALRRSDLGAPVAVFEIDQPGPQRWKEERLARLDLKTPDGLRFVPVDFETGESWTQRLVAGGFDPGRPAVLSALGLTQYISEAATVALLEDVAALAPAVTLVASFVVPDALVDDAERPLVAQTRTVAAARNCPWVADYSPERIMELARRAGFDEVRHVGPDELTRRYLAGRSDGLRVPSGEQLVVARRNRNGAPANG